MNKEENSIMEQELSFSLVEHFKEKKVFDKKKILSEISEVIDIDMALLNYDNDIESFITNKIDTTIIESIQKEKQMGLVIIQTINLTSYIIKEDISIEALNYIEKIRNTEEFDLLRNIVIKNTMMTLTNRLIDELAMKADEYVNKNGRFGSGFAKILGDKNGL